MVILCGCWVSIYSSKYEGVEMMSYSAECTLIVMSCVLWLLRH